MMTKLPYIKYYLEVLVNNQNTLSSASNTHFPLRLILHFNINVSKSFQISTFKCKQIVRNYHSFMTDYSKS